jgi:hypothetical protein
MEKSGIDLRIDGEPTRQQVIEAHLHRAPSVGTVVKQLMEVNPNLSAQDLMGIVRASTRRQGETAGEFAIVEVIDIPHAISLAKASLISN